jgi:hypothetical protein
MSLRSSWAFNAPINIEGNYFDGSSALKASTSAAAIKALTGTNTNGVYYIDLPTVGPTPVYCIMDSAWNGGGWMMAMKATRGTTFSFYSTHWNTVTTVNPAQYNQNDGDAKFDTMNYFQGKDLLARWPDIGSGGSIGGLGNWTWLQNNFADGSRTTLINFFNTAGSFNTGNVNTGGNYGGKFVQEAKSWPGWANGVFSSQADIRFYGFNFKNYKGYGLQANCRWGFGWNENGEGVYSSFNTLTTGGAPGSDDVSGGLGLDSSYGNYSAGDYIGCCQDSTGINRSARVEMYVR